MKYHELLNSYVKNSTLSHREISRRSKEKGTSISQAYISQLIKGDVPPPSEEVSRTLAEITGSDPEELIMAAYYERAPQEVKKVMDKGEAYDQLFEYMVKNRPIKGDFENSELTNEEIEKEMSFLNSPQYLATLSREDIDAHLTEIVNHMIKNQPHEYLDMIKTTSLYDFFETNKNKLYLLSAMRKQEGKTFKEMAEYLEISEADYFMLEKVSEMIDLSKNDIDEIYKKGIQRMRESLLPYNEDSMLRLPILSAIRAGEPIGQIENNEGYTLIDPDLLQGHEGFALHAQGDSMSGDRIQEGDIVIVLKQEEIGPNDIAVVAIEDNEAILRRVKLHGDMVMLAPSNSLFEPQLLPAKSVAIIGKVVEVKIRMK